MANSLQKIGGKTTFDFKRKNVPFFSHCSSFGSSFYWLFSGCIWSKCALNAEQLCKTRKLRTTRTNLLHIFIVLHNHQWNRAERTELISFQFVFGFFFAHLQSIRKKFELIRRSFFLSAGVWHRTFRSQVPYRNAFVVQLNFIRSHATLFLVSSISFWARREKKPEPQLQREWFCG